MLPSAVKATLRYSAPVGQLNDKLADCLADYLAQIQAVVSSGFCLPLLTSLP